MHDTSEEGTQTKILRSQMINISKLSTKTELAVTGSPSALGQKNRIGPA